VPVGLINGEHLINKREGLMLYWCEGDKYTSKNKYKVALTTTDEKMLNLFIKWTNKYYFVKKEQIRLRLHIWPEINEKNVKKHWSNILKLPVENFTKSWIKPRGGRKAKHPNGVCRASFDSKQVFKQILKDINQEFKKD